MSAIHKWLRYQTESDVWVDDLLDLARDTNAVLWGAEVGQIKKSVGPWLRKRMHQRKDYVVIESMPHIGDKAANAQSFRAMAKAGHIYIPLTEWGDNLIRQLIKFPAGAFDDGVDACGILGRLISTVWDAKTPKPEEQPKPRDYRFNDDSEDNWKTY